MSGSKPFGPSEDFPQKSPAGGKPILTFDPTIPANFTNLQDTFPNYTGKAGKALIVNSNENGITTSTGVLTSDANYIHTQIVASDTWVIIHNLGKYPSVRIKDETGASLTGDIEDNSINQITIYFSTAKAGTAIIN